VACLFLVAIAMQCAFAVRRDNDDEPVEPEPEPEVPKAEPETPAHTTDEKSSASQASNGKEARSQGGDGYDTDEFESNGEKKAASGGKKASGTDKTKDAETTPKQESFEDSLPPFFLEGAMLCIALAFAVNFVIGKNANEKIAHEWASIVLNDQSSMGVTKNFALVGDNSQRLEKVLIKDSQSNYLMHATGRRHCKSLLATLDLNKRHDLFAKVYCQMFMKPSLAADELKIQVPLNDLAKFCFAICPKSEVRKVRQDCSDVSKYAHPVTVKKLSKELVLLTDCEEIVPEMLRSEASLKIIDKLKSHLRLVHVSDKSEADPRYPCMLQCTFQLPAKLQDPSGPGAKMVTDMMHLAIHLIDVCAKASDWQAKHPQVGLKVEQTRTERSKSKKAHVRQQEAAQHRKDLKAAAEKEKMENMDPEVLRAYEEKKYRQDLKKQMKRRTKMQK